MAKKRCKTKCAYCGVNDATTHDHIPPRGCFPDDPDLRKNLITVPACRVCHPAESDDDQYLQLVVGSHIGNWKNPLAKDLHPRMLRGVKLGGPSHRKLKAAARIVTVPLRTKAGVLMPVKVPAIDIDQQALERVMARVLRGLYYRHSGRQRLPDNMEVKAVMLPGLGQIENPARIRSRAEVLDFVQETRARMRAAKSSLHNIGPGIFKYRYMVDDRIPERSVWLMCFYDRIEFLGTIHPKVPRTPIILLPR